MTQLQMDAPQPLPRCKLGHPVRYMLDARCAKAGGGHLIECRCCSTRKHSSFSLVLQDWRRMHVNHAVTIKPVPDMHLPFSSLSGHEGSGCVIILQVQSSPAMMGVFGSTGRALSGLNAANHTSIGERQVDLFDFTSNSANAGQPCGEQRLGRKLCTNL